MAWRRLPKAARFTPCRAVGMPGSRYQSLRRIEHLDVAEDRVHVTVANLTAGHVIRPWNVVQPWPLRGVGILVMGRHAFVAGSYSSTMSVLLDRKPPMLGAARRPPMT